MNWVELVLEYIMLLFPEVITCCCMRRGGENLHNSGSAKWSEWGGECLRATTVFFLFPCVPPFFLLRIPSSYLVLSLFFTPSDFFTPFSIPLQSFFIPSSLLLRSFFVPSSFLLRSFFVPSSFLLRSFFVPSSFLLRSFLVPSSFLLRFFLIPSAFLLRSFSYCSFHVSSLLFASSRLLIPSLRIVFLAPHKIPPLLSSAKAPAFPTQSTHLPRPL
jgi:hypothetical protein